MKRILSLVFLLISVFSYADSVQQGCVKTRGRMTADGQHIPGKGLPGAIVSINDRTDIGVKNNNGTFSFPVTNNQFRVDSVKKKDYVLLDADAASKTYTHTADVIYFVMETPEQILQDKLATERRLRRNLQTKLQTRENELDSLITIQKITREEYQQRLQNLYAEQSEKDKLISDMAERYSTLDYDQMDEFYRQVSYHIEQCEFVKADSLLKSRGNIHAQLEAAKQQGQVITQKEEELQQAKRVHQHDIDELAKRCYSYYENFKMQHQNDSAAYYLEQRAKLDNTNTHFLIDLANFTFEYMAQYDLALEYYKQALSIRKHVFGDSHPEVATLYNNLGYVYSERNDYTHALEYYQQALSIWKLEYGEFHPNVATLYNNIGSVHVYKDNFDKALEYFQAVLAIRQQILSKSHPDMAQSYNNIGYVSSKLGNYVQALEYHQHALEVEKLIYGKSHPSIATSYNNIGEVYRNMSDYKHALEYHQHALNIWKRFLGDYHFKVALSYNNIGVVYQNLCEYDYALENYQHALVIWKQVFGDVHTYIALSYSNIGSIYHLSTSDYDSALDFFSKALEIRKQIYGKYHPDVATSYYNIGMVYRDKGEYIKALDNFQESSIILNHVFGSEHPKTKHVQGIMAITTRNKKNKR